MPHLGKFVRAGPHETQGLSRSTGKTPRPKGICSDPSCLPWSSGQYFWRSLWVGLNTQACLSHMPSSVLCVAMAGSARTCFGD